jgi:glyoxylase-like metal-dependent hydrolase (beta-lactamase superfamily II)
VLISLPGHTRGHACVAIDADHRWVLHGGDSIFHHGTLDRHSHVPRALAAMETLIAFDRKMVRDNHARLAEPEPARRPRIIHRSLSRPGPLQTELAHMHSGRSSDGTPTLNGAQALIRTLVDAGVTTCLGNH